MSFRDGNGKEWFGPTICRVERTLVDGLLVRVTLEPIGNDQTVELTEGAEFVAVLSGIPIAPLSVWEK